MVSARAGVLKELRLLQAIHLIWRSYVLSKVGVFGWKLLQERIPTKVTKFSFRIISNQESYPCKNCLVVNIFLVETKLYI